MLETIKNFMTKSTPQDKAAFYTFERIADSTTATYRITNCTKGFIGLLVRSRFKTEVAGSTIVIKSLNGVAERTITMDDLTEELIRIKKK